MVTGSTTCGKEFITENVYLKRHLIKFINHVEAYMALESLKFPQNIKS